MNILVTGGAGFIGSHLAAKLLAKHDVTIVDMLHPYYSPERKRLIWRKWSEAGLAAGSRRICAMRKDCAASWRRDVSMRCITWRQFPA